METRYWQREVETASRADLEKLQEKKLRRMLEYVGNRSAFYQDKFQKHVVSLSKISTLKDLKQLPFTDREEIFEDQSAHGQFGTLMCTDFKEPGQAIGQTGDRFSATGKPLRVIVSVTDLANQGKLAARGLMSAGIRHKDYLYIADFPQFNLIYMHMGLGSINVGSTSLLIGMERAERNIRIYMELYPPTSFFISPSYAKFMGNLVRTTGSTFPVKTLIGWNEPGYSLPAIREEIESLWQGTSTEDEVKVCDAYGMMELGLLGFECRYQRGLHGFEDSYIYEIINPETGEVVDPGEEGELVVTHLDREGIPLIRYRTGDITSIDDSPCSCGRTHIRLQGVKGRWMDRLEVQGTVIYSGQVDEAVAQTKEYKGGHNIFINGSRKLDALEIAVDQDRITPSLKKMMKDEIEGELSVPVTLKLLAASQLFVYPHRSRRIIDQSNLDRYRKELKTQMAVET